MMNPKDVKCPNFIAEDGRVFLVRCPACDLENWAGAVSEGVCAWCAFDANDPAPTPPVESFRPSKD